MTLLFLGFETGLVSCPRVFLSAQQEAALPVPHGFYIGTLFRVVEMGSMSFLGQGTSTEETWAEKYWFSKWAEETFHDVQLDRNAQEAAEEHCMGIVAEQGRAVLCETGNR